MTAQGRDQNEIGGKVPALGRTQGAGACQCRRCARWLPAVAAAAALRQGQLAVFERKGAVARRMERPRPHLMYWDTQRKPSPAGWKLGWDQHSARAPAPPAPPSAARLP
jgi:hypothetical protein